MNEGKLVVLGGSSLNTPALMAALADHRELSLDEVCLVGRSAAALARVGAFCQSMAAGLGLGTTVTWDTDLARAAAGARFVLNMLRVGGPQADAAERYHLALSGIVGHASSYPEALRHLPPTLEAVRTLEAVAPLATFVNFTNPVSVLVEAIARQSPLKCIGICHHAFKMRDDFAAMLKAPSAAVSVDYLGINHLGWVTDVTVEGRSRLPELLDALIARKDKEYNYQVIRPFNLIPIRHAFALYHKGEVLFVREKGIRGSVKDVLIRLLPRRSSRVEATSHELAQAIQDGRQGVVETLRARAPWYDRCIVPFVTALASGRPAEFIVTWQHGGQVADLPNQTAESRVRIEGGKVQGIQPSRGLPPFAAAWLRQARDSEALLIDAVRENSYDLALQALLIHPNVVSPGGAERMLAGLRGRQTGQEAAGVQAMYETLRPDTSGRLPYRRMEG